MADATTDKPRADRMSAPRTIRPCEWAEAQMVLGCEMAEAKGWLSVAWRQAWWLRGGWDGRVAQWCMVGEEGDVLRWVDSGTQGGVWLALAPEGGHLRAMAWSAPSAAVAGDAMPWDEMRDRSLDDERGAWLYWWDVVRAMRGQEAAPTAATRVGALGVYELGDGGAAIGRIAEVVKGRVTALTVAGGAVLPVAKGGRGWPWNDSWKDTAFHAMVGGAVTYKSVNSAVWTLVHLRKRLKREGILGEDGRVLGSAMTK